MSLQQYVHRELVKYKVTDLEPYINGDVEIANWSNIAIYIDDEHSKFFDIGRFQYARRSYKNEGARMLGHTSKVILSSLVPARKIFVQGMVRWLYETVASGGNKRYLRKRVEVISRFVNYCDENLEESCLSSIEDIKKSYGEYIENLRHQISISKISSVTASSYQGGLRGAVCVAFDIEDMDELNRYAMPIRSTGSSTFSTRRLPDEINYGRTLEICTQLFLQLSDIIISKKPLPHKIEVLEKSYWVMPVEKRIFLAPVYDDGCKWKWYVGAAKWDYDNGRIKTTDEILALLGTDRTIATMKQLNEARCLIRSAEETLKYGNAAFSGVKKRIISLANQCYFFIYMSASGSNLQQAIDLDVDSEVSHNKTPGFKSKKGRANGAEVEYIISNRVSSLHKKYLVLRDVVLTLDPSYSGLFYKVPSISGTKLNLQRISNRTFGALHKKITVGLGIKLDYINAREFRNLKADYMINTHGVAVAAMMMQNKISTVEDTYAQGSDSNVANDIPLVFQRIDDLIDARAKTIESAVGRCKSIGNPSSGHLEPSIEPDCRTAVGCLFCTSYRIVANETDIRKICSALYFIAEIKVVTVSAEHFDEVYGESQNKLEWILDEIKKKNTDLCKLVSEIYADVFDNENLTDYFQRKLDMFFGISGFVS